MNRVIASFLAVACLTVAVTSAAKADSLVGVITSYVSGNEGTDMTVKTADGHVHALWFDNMKKPSFRGKQLPWCPEFPCQGWPSQLVLGKTHVQITVVTQRVEGKTIVTPLKIDLAR
jgi:hypothetical protein